MDVLRTVYAASAGLQGLVKEHNAKPDDQLDDIQSRILVWMSNIDGGMQKLTPRGALVHEGIVSARGMITNAQAKVASARLQMAQGVPSGARQQRLAIATACMLTIAAAGCDVSIVVAMMEWEAAEDASSHGSSTCDDDSVLDGDSAIGGRSGLGSTNVIDLDDYQTHSDADGVTDDDDDAFEDPPRWHKNAPCTEVFRRIPLGHRVCYADTNVDQSRTTTSYPLQVQVYKRDQESMCLVRLQQMGLSLFGLAIRLYWWTCMPQSFQPSQPRRYFRRGTCSTCTSTSNSDGHHRLQCV
jgi:hypothetical protein